MTITKTDYITFLEAPMHLWATKHQPENVDPPDEQALLLMEQGKAAEKLALKYVSEVLLPSYQEASFETQKTFSDGPFEARVDVLLYDHIDGCYDLFEVKASNEIKNEHIQDVSFQVLVCETCIPIRNAYVLHLNKNYVRAEELDLSQLFMHTNVTAEVDALREEVQSARQAALLVVAASDPALIESCLNPKNCQCNTLCHPGLPEYHIYLVPRLSKTKKLALKSQGVFALQDVPPGFELSAKQQRQLTVMQNQKSYLDPVALGEELQKLKTPLYFLDYESFNPAVPLFKGYKPYQHIVFQYSLHIYWGEGQDLEHRECLITDPKDPAPELLHQLAKDISEEGTVVVWNRTFEATRNKEMAERLPAYKDFLHLINERIYDLADIVSTGVYVHPQFFGSYSIKNVLPVMAPDLSYKQLTVQEGTQAMKVWWQLFQQAAPPQELMAKREALLSYCKLDTLAMVRIWEAFKELLA